MQALGGYDNNHRPSPHSSTKFSLGLSIRNSPAQPAVVQLLQNEALPIAKAALPLPGRLQSFANRLQVRIP
eukprot:m.676548 g.676548  ORF g.676548 m.676548 type:complete len:71 (-) comp58563_c0_seq7:1070-1282(-)